ncbi:MAG: DUF72 domain-containing protein [Saprospiraceae bacterium]|nr:DUF72 domain-containing protein [Saprospiraceae bacterium]
MKFGHLEIPLASFKPIEEPRFWFQGSSNQGNIYFGSTNWTEAYWKGLIYPPKAKPNEFLSHHSRFFNTIELNTTFYRNPGVEQILKWKNATPEHFMFCPKVPSRISQSKLLGTDTELWSEFETSVQHFDSQLGPCFLQLPEYFDRSRSNIVEELISGNFFHKNILIEFRHSSWFSSSENLEKICSLLSSKNNGLVITDTPGRQDVLHNNICCEKILVRFVSDGNPLHDQERLDNWSERIEQMLSGGIKEIHFILHHPNPEQMIALTKIMMTRHTNS